MKEFIQSPDLIRERLHRFLMVTFIASGVLLFAPERLMSQLKLDALLENYGALISLIYLITLCYFFVLALGFIWQQVNGQVQSRRAGQLAEIKAASLDHEERALLREFFLQRTRSLLLPVNQEAIQRLLHSHVLQNLEPYPSEEPLQRFGIAPSARRFITSNNLRLPVNELTEEDIRYFKASRPEYIKDQLKRQWRDQLRAQRRQAA